MRNLWREKQQTFRACTFVMLYGVSSSPRDQSEEFYSLGWACEMLRMIAAPWTVAFAPCVLRGSVRESAQPARNEKIVTTFNFIQDIHSTADVEVLGMCNKAERVIRYPWVVQRPIHLEIRTRLLLAFFICWESEKKNGRSHQKIIFH